MDAGAAWEAMSVDKKAENGKCVFVLPERIGCVRKVSGLDRAAVDRAWEALEGK